MEPNRKSTRSPDGTDLYYETYAPAGQTPQLLLVHGIGGDLDAWQFMREPLRAMGYSIAALDLRGHGYSGHPRARDSYTLGRLCEDVGAVLDAERMENAALVGHSGGAVVALAYALKHQGRLSSLVLLAGSYGPPRSMRNVLVRRLSHLALSIGALLGYRVKARWHSPYPKGKVHKEIEWYGLTRTIYHNSLRSYALLCKTLMRVDLGSSLGRLALPVLLVTGENDGIYPAADARLMHEKIPGSILRLVPGANHPLPLNEPEACVRTTAEFLQKSKA